MYELKDYLNSINYTKENLLDSEDEMWKRNIPPSLLIDVYLVHKIL